MNFFSSHAGIGHYNRKKEKSVTYWTPPPVYQLKWNTHASLIESRKSNTISYVRKDNK